VAVGLSGLLSSASLRARREGGGESFVRQPEMRRGERDEFRNAAGTPHQRQVGVIHRLEQHDLIAWLDQGQQRTGQGLGRARRDHDLAVRIEIEALPMAIVHCDGIAQLRQTHHRRILVPAIDNRICGFLPHVEWAGIIREALTEIDGVVLAGKPRHDLEHSGGQICEDRVHGNTFLTGPP
jgi:hypothetical protein